MLRLFVVLLLAVIVSAALIIVFPGNILAQSTTPWNFYNNPTTDLDIYYGTGGAPSTPLVKLKTNGNMGLGTANPTQKLDIIGNLALSSKDALQGGDSWLRLNQSNQFSNGVHTPGLMAPGSLNVAAGSWQNPGYGNAVIGGTLQIDGYNALNFKYGGYNTPQGTFRLTPNVHINTPTNYGVLINWDNGSTTDASVGQFAVGNGQGGSLMSVARNGVTTVANLHANNDTWLPHTSGWNYIRGNTYAFNAPWLDENNGGYYIDPNGNNRMANGYFDATLINWPGYNGIAQAYGHYIWPGSNDGSGRTWQQSWYLASHQSYGLYTNTGMYFAGNVFAPFWYDSQNTGYYVDPNGYTNLNVARRVYGFNGREYDENNSGYFVDPSDTSAFQRIGIRTGGPAADLHIKQTDNSQGGAGGIRLERSDSGGFARIFHGGNDQLHLFSGNNGQYCFLRNDAAWICGSDRRLKENITPLAGSALDLLDKLKPSTFNFIGNEKKSAGFIAQEVAEVLPGAVEESTANGYLGVSDQYLTPFIVKSVQELNQKVKDQDKQISDLKQEIELLKQMIK